MGNNYLIAYMPELHEDIARMVQNKDVPALRSVELALHNAVERVTEIIDKLDDQGVSAHVQKKCRTEALKNVAIVRGHIDTLLSVNA